MNSFCKNAAAVGGLLLFLCVSGVAARAAPIVIKMATVAPEGSSWHSALLDMGEEWKKVSGGKVVLRIYAGGVVGDEETMLRKMRVGQLQASAITGLGLTFLDRSFYALHVPMVFSSEEEFDYVRDRLSPRLEKILEEKGYIVLNWGDAGWVRFFAKEPFTHPEEMEKMKLVLGAGDSTLTQLYKEAGFQPVPISIVDVLPALQTGLVDAFNAVPLAALAFQWFALAPNMADLKWSFLAGATVVDRRAWKKIPEEIRPKILEVSRATSLRLRKEIRALNDGALEAMVENGLKIHHISPSVEAEWRKIVEDIYPQIRGKITPADIFDEVIRVRDEYRRSKEQDKAATR